MSRQSALSVMPALPDEFVARQSALLGREAPAFLAALSGPPTRALRVNPHKVGLSQIADRLGLAIDPVPWCPTASYLPPEMRLGDSAEHRAGLFYLQEPSSMAVVEALGIQSHHRVLDIAAAPGGKATHAAAKLGPDGLLLANEVVAARIGPLLANLDAWGYPSTAVAKTSPARLADALPGFFDRIIVDAPCSGETLFRRDPASRAQWSGAQVRGAARRQAKLLASAARTAAPGAKLAYSTCTFAPAENEEQVARFLDAHVGWEPVDLSRLPGSELGRSVSVQRGQALQFWPHLCRCEGQFICVLKAPDGRGHDQTRWSARHGRTVHIHPAWRAFAERNLRRVVDPAQIVVRGDTFYLVPSALMLDPPLALLRPGLMLGRLVGKTFQPAHALAMALGADDAIAAEALAGEDLRAFRSGHRVTRPGPDGWVLATIQDWPIGWAQRKGGVLAPRLPGHARART